GAPPATQHKAPCGTRSVLPRPAPAPQLAADVVRALAPETRVRVVLCPPAPYLGLVGEELRGTAVALGAQNVYPEKEGAFTGETGINMLLDLSCRYAIVGHSERRRHLGEVDPIMSRKVQAALAAGLEVIACVGETLEQRRGGETKACLESPLAGAPAGLTPAQGRPVRVAYQPLLALR